MLLPALRPQLLCLPHAGGSAVMYHAWRPGLAEVARVRPVDLPGHGSRRREPLAQDIGTLTRTLAAELAPGIEGPYAVFGHSFGAVVAFELTHRLSQLVGPPAALIVSGRNSPRTPHALPPLHNAPPAQLLSGLRTLEGALPAVEDSPELLDLFLPPLRADLRMTETYRRPTELPPLSCPVHVFAGDLDPVVDAPGLAAWAAETTGPCRVTTVRGGHMMLASAELRSALADLLTVGAM
ncbi:thioesterase II family protein [Streptomyces sp. NPDC088197]|uniref:thioesterase II family protein n=1 Tax=unclassified Streptomyces TaxID=2593676 RepID=UPI0033A75422